MFTHLSEASLEELNRDKSPLEFDAMSEDIQPRDKNGAGVLRKLVLDFSNFLLQDVVHIQIQEMMRLLIMRDFEASVCANICNFNQFVVSNEKDAIAKDQLVYFNPEQSLRHQQAAFLNQIPGDDIPIVFPVKLPICEGMVQIFKCLKQMVNSLVSLF